MSVTTYADAIAATQQPGGIYAAIFARHIAAKIAQRDKHMRLARRYRLDPFQCAAHLSIARMWNSAAVALIRERNAE